MKTVLAACFLALSFCAAEARPSPWPQVQEFNGDRWLRTAQGASAGDVTRAVRTKRTHQRARRWQRRPVPKPGTVAPIGVFHGLKREAVEAMPSRWLVGIVPPLAAKAREIVAACGSKVISGVRHTYVAGTGGRLSLHASGRAVDIRSNPVCIYAHLRGWPGGYSVDYGRVKHVHISYAPRGAEWGRRFTHYRGDRRHRHARRRA